MTASKWDWIQQSPRGGIDASALSKLFRNRSDNMGPDDLLAREAIQNSADASKDYRKQGVPFRLRFKFVEYQGKDAEKIDMVEYIIPRAKQSYRTLGEEDRKQYRATVIALLDTYLDYMAPE